MPESTPPPPQNTPVGLSIAQRARLTQRMRQGLAALSLVGAVLIALPVAQLLRYQSAELKSMQVNRAALDPVARAVHLQRGLLAHRDLAAQVLRGQDKLELDRKQRQTEVDGRLAALMVTLASGRWELAIGEADDLRIDWLQLARQVLERQIDAPSSDAAHRLLVEQTLQVIDLVSASAQLEGQNTVGLNDGVPAATMHVIRVMPRLAWLTAQLAVPAPGADAQHAHEAAQRRLPQLETALARALGPIEGLPRRTGVHGADGGDANSNPNASTSTSTSTITSTSAGGESPAGNSPLLTAAAAAGANTDRYFRLLRSNDGESPEALAALQAAVQAQLSLFDVAHGQATTLLTERARQSAQSRALLLGGMSLGLVMAAALMMGLRRDLRALQADDMQQALAGVQPGAGDGQSGGRQQAELLLQRLREGEPGDTSGPGASEPASPDPAARRRTYDA
jgi:hypothetical protein